MRKALTIAMCLALVAPAARAASPAVSAPFDASPGRYVLDRHTASLVIHLSGIGSPTLRLTRLDGRFRYDPAEWRQTRVAIDADPDSIVASRGYVAHRAALLFEPDKYPTIAFHSTSLKWTDADHGLAQGELTFHGVTRPVTLQVELKDAGPGGPDGAERVRFCGRGKVKRSDFGIREGFPFVGDSVNLVFDMEFVRQPTVEAQR